MSSPATYALALQANGTCISDLRVSLIYLLAWHYALRLAGSPQALSEGRAAGVESQIQLSRRLGSQHVSCPPQRVVHGWVVLHGQSRKGGSCRFLAPHPSQPSAEELLKLGHAAGVTDEGQ